jgi:multicomponent Na+:H+ antiporter subunit E
VLFGTRRSGQIIARPLRTLHFAGYFAYKLVEATIVVARTVIVPRDRIRTGIVSVELRGCSDAVVTIIADAISHTPGTLTLEVRREPLTLFIHVLHLSDVEQVRRDVRKLEVLAVRAFGTADALAGLAEDDTDAWEGTG